MEDQAMRARDLRERDNNSIKARKALDQTRQTRDFGYHGDLDLAGHSAGAGLWGFTGIDVHRDSDALDRSNFDVISKDLLARFPVDCEVMHASHWAVGWVDQLLVKWTSKTGVITLAGLAVLEWQDTLSDYPVADEDHYFELDSEERRESMVDSIHWLLMDYETSNESNDSAIESWLFTNQSDVWQEAYEDGGDFSDYVDAVLDACAALHFFDYNQF